MGRRSTGKPIVGIDLGGTKILAGVVAKDGTILGQSKRPTKPEIGPEGVVDRIVKTVLEAVEAAEVSRSDIAAAGAGAPGPLDPDRGVILTTPNLAGWKNVPLADMLGERLGLPVFVGNDVDLGTLGEHAFGAGKGVRDLVGIFVGTGIGGGIILGGSLRLGWRRTAGEIGHMILLAEGPVCGCGNRGCAEAVASRTAIERDILAGIQSGQPSLVTEILKRDQRERLTSGVLAEAYAARDPLVLGVLDRAQFYLGLLAASVVNLIDPEMIIFGGGVVEAFGDDFVAPIRQVAFENMINKTGEVKIVAAHLGDSATLLGASELARRKASRRSRK
jgi:glucokinase